MTKVSSVYYKAEIKVLSEIHSHLELGSISTITGFGRTQFLVFIGLATGFLFY